MANMLKVYLTKQRSKTYLGARFLQSKTIKTCFYNKIWQTKTKRIPSQWLVFNKDQKTYLGSTFLLKCIKDGPKNGPRNGPPKVDTPFKTNKTNYSLFGSQAFTIFHPSGVCAGRFELSGAARSACQ